MKQYNEVIEQKQDLERLLYNHSRMNRWSESK